MALLAPAVLAALGALAPARAQNDDAPCIDGVFSGEVGDAYQQILDEHAADPTASFYSTLSAAKQAFVAECAGKPGPDSERYDLREVVEVTNFPGGQAGETFVLGRVYDYLDPDPSVLCDAGGSNCRQVRYYYAALVMSGCYVDNVFAGASSDDVAYLESVGWGNQHTFNALRGSDMGVMNVACTGDPGISLQPLAYDLIGTIQSNGTYRNEGGSLSGDPDANEWDSNVNTSGQAGTVTVGTLPDGFTAETSSVWNMTFSGWDPAIGATRTSETTWKSPFETSSALCDGSGCDLGYASTWWDPEHLWEWQVVYEFRWDVSGCETLDPDTWQLDFNTATHASPHKQDAALCAASSNLGALTVIKSTVPDPGTPWGDFRFNVAGPSPGTAVLQDPGAGECAEPNPWATCDSSPPWDHEDRETFEGLIASNSSIFGGGHVTYSVTETAEPGTDLSNYTTTWLCRNVNPLTCTPELVASLDQPLDDPLCGAVDPAATCSAQGWLFGETSGTGTGTGGFSICPGAHVVCEFRNEGSVCLESENAIGDLQVFGASQPDQTSFSTAAVPVQSGDTEDVLFMASFTPLPDQSRWPGEVDQYVLPLPVIENAQGDLVPDTAATCADDESTGCLAWRAGEEMLAQAPDASQVATDRRIGTGAEERRVTYTQGESSTAVPRSIRRFDWSDSDAPADEYDLWDGFGYDDDYVQGDPDSEASVRSQARGVIDQTLVIKQASIFDPDAPSGTSTLSFVAGDFFHSDPRLVAGPQNFFYLANDLEGNGRPCDDTVNPNRGYRCFFEKHRRRSRVLLAASNDGQLHAFDAGRFSGSVVSQRLTGSFDYGTGREVFAHIPRPMLAHTRAMTQDEHAFGIDGAITVDDFFLDPVHAGAPASADREWRTVAIGTYREGGRGLFAIDLTQPDPVEARSVLDFAGQPDVEWVPDLDSSYVPSCSALASSPPSGCGTLPYPAVLWEFDDRCTFTDPSTGTTFTDACDEDGNGHPDLGYGWSAVNSGRVLVNVEGEDDPVVRYVAVFGGGLDPENRIGVGNFLYMVDVETGRAIYKRALDSAAPSEPAAVDTNQDGILDTIYIGTTGGLLYKVDLSVPADLDASTGRVDDADQWAPLAVFDTGGRPIFYPPTVTYVASQGRYALAFGTGDREDLFAEDVAGVEGRFYMIVDPGFVAGSGVLASGPLTETSFQIIDRTDAGITGDLLTAPQGSNLPGWVLRLSADERVVTRALALSGLLVFTTFDPETPLVCDFGGLGSIYALLATNANSIYGTDEPRALTVEGYAGQPVVMPSGMTQSSSQGGAETDPFEAAAIDAVRRSLMDLFPADCRFGSFSLNVGVTLSNTSQVPIASVPVCVVRRNWTEH